MSPTLRTSAPSLGPHRSLRTLSLLLAVSVASSCVAQSAAPATKTSAGEAGASAKHQDAVRVSPAASKAELEALKDSLAKQYAQQQKLLEAVQEQNRLLGEKLAQAEQTLSAAEQKIDSVKNEQSPVIAKLQTEVAAVQTAQVSTSKFIAVEKALLPELQNPSALHYKGVTLTPGGFVAVESLYRAHAENTDMSTSWVSIPYDAQSASSLSEFRMSSRSTRLGLLFQGAKGNNKLTGYFEIDFQATGYGASEVQSNAYSPRMRQLWGQVETAHKLTFTGGQTWSLLTTNYKGIHVLNEFTTPLIDCSQFIGHDYARQAAFRVTKESANAKYTMAFSVENPATVVVIPSNVTTAVSGTIVGLSTTGIGVLSNTTYSTNLAPDLIAKVAFDPGYGHFEIKALGRTFRERQIPTTAVPTGTNETVLGGGLGAAMILPIIAKRVDFVADGMWGNVGRYGATATDVIIKPSGGISPEKSIHLFGGFLTHPTPKLDWYAFGGDEYLNRNHGYGLSTIDNSKCFAEATFSCSANVKNLSGVTTGVWFRPYKGSFGTVQYGAEYSYISKITWSGIGGAPRATENVAEGSFRYYLP